MFYHALLLFFSDRDNGKPNGARRSIVLTIYKKCTGRLAFEFTEAWLDKLYENHRLSGEGLGTDEDYNKICELFVMAAFKDLSLIKNPEAKRIFAQLAKEFALDRDLFLWVSKITKSNGTEIPMAVVTLHVSDWQMFQDQFQYLRENGRILTGEIEKGLRIDYA